LLSFFGLGIKTGVVGLTLSRWPRLGWPLVVTIMLLWLCWFVVMQVLKRMGY